MRAEEKEKSVLIYDKYQREKKVGRKRGEKVQIRQH
jgi:hypothetical protein